MLYLSCHTVYEYGEYRTCARKSSQFYSASHASRTYSRKQNLSGSLLQEWIALFGFFSAARAAAIWRDLVNRDFLGTKDEWIWKSLIAQLNWGKCTWHFYEGWHPSSLLRSASVWFVYHTLLHVFGSLESKASLCIGVSFALQKLVWLLANYMMHFSSLWILFLSFNFAWYVLQSI